MSKKVKLVSNILLSLALIGSLVWGYAVRNISCMFERACGLEQTGYWPVVFLFVIPIILVIALILVNKKK